MRPPARHLLIPLLLALVGFNAVQVQHGTTARGVSRRKTPVAIRGALSDEVVADNHIGAWGTPMGMVICELKREKPELPYYDAAFTGEYPSTSPVTMEDLEEIYPAASAALEPGDPPLTPTDLVDALSLLPDRVERRRAHDALAQILARHADRVAVIRFGALPPLTEVIQS